MEIYKTFSPWMGALRNALLFINATFTVLAVFLIAAGAVITGVYNNFDSFLELYHILPARLLIVIGSILILVTCFGWFGTIKLNVLSLKLYCGLLITLVAINVTVSIISFVALFAAESEISITMFNSVKQFEMFDDIRQSWNYVQSEYSCCGVYFPENWYGIKGNGINGGAPIQYKGFKLKFPYSCCVGGNCTEGVIYEEGCANHIIDYVSNATLLSACLLIALALIQVIAVMVTCSFVTRIKRCLRNRKIHKHLRKSIVLLSPNSITHKADFI